MRVLRKDFLVMNGIVFNLPKFPMCPIDKEQLRLCWKIEGMGRGRLSCNVSLLRLESYRKAKSCGFDSCQHRQSMR